jgi:hypothetical protein
MVEGFLSAAGAECTVHPMWDCVRQALAQTTQDTETPALLLVLGLPMIALGAYTLVMGVRGFRGTRKDMPGYRTVNLGAWVFGPLMLISGITLIVVYLSKLVG